MQQKNLLVFIVLCIAILVGWGMLQERIWPRKQKDDKIAHKDKDGQRVAPPVSVEDLRPQAPRLLAAAVFHGRDPINPLLLAGQLAADKTVARVAEERKAAARQFARDLPRAAPQLAALLANPGPNGGALVLARLTLGDRFKLPSETASEVDLSGPDFFLEVKLTTRGAGVRRLTLPKFDAATELGRPAFEIVNGQRVPVKLDLIPDDPIRPSFLMFHYPNPGANPDDPDPAERRRARPSPELGDAVWKLESERTNDRKEREVVFTYDVRDRGFEGIKIRKIYTLGPTDYHIGVSVEIEDKRAAPRGEKLLPFRYQLTGAHGIPIEGEWYASVFRQPMLGLLTREGHPFRDQDQTQHSIAFQEGGARVPPPNTTGTIQWAGVANQYFTSLIVVADPQAPPGDGGVKPDEVVSYARPTLESTEVVGKLEAVQLMKEGGFLTLSAPAPDRPGVLRVRQYRLLEEAARNIRERGIEKGAQVVVNFYESGREGLVATGVRLGTVPRPHLEDITVRVVSHELFTDQRPSRNVVHKYLFYNGPVKVSLLGQFRGDKAVNPKAMTLYEGPLNLRLLTDYHSPGWLGSFANKIFWTDLIIFFTRVMHWLLDKLHFVLGNYGLSIIVLTLIVRGLMFPISRRQAILSIKMQELAPEVKKVQEKYKSDPQARNRAVMELYRKHNVNPLGGCLTLLLQLPVFMGLYYALQESIHFRLAGFLWIQNLAAPDMLIWWTENIPIISNPDHMGEIGYLGPFFNLLPVFAVVLMLVQQKLMTPPPADEQQATQQKVFKYMMILMGFLFYKLPAGLCLYFIVSSLWGLAERRLLPKRPVPGLAGGPGRPGRDGGGGGGGKGPTRGGGGGGGRSKGRPSRKDKEPEGAIQKVRNWWQEVLKQAKKK
jgi:YidC/Oxa1 family membrane protein insertase